MYPVILRVVEVEPGGGEIIREHRLIGVKVRGTLILKAHCPYEQFFKIRVSHTHVDQDNLFVGSEETLNRVMIVLSTDGLKDNKLKRFSFNSKSRAEIRLRKQIDIIHQTYSNAILYTV